MRYRTNEISFELPGEGWHDESINVLRIDAPDRSRLALVMTRSPAVDEAGLAARVESDLKQESRQLRGFELLGRAELVSGEIRGLAVRFRWLHEQQGAFHNEIAYVPLPDRLVVLTVTGMAAQAAACGELLQEIVHTLTIA